MRDQGRKAVVMRGKRKQGKRQEEKKGATRDGEQCNVTVEIGNLLGRCQMHITFDCQQMLCSSLYLLPLQIWIIMMQMGKFMIQPNI